MTDSHDLIAEVRELDKAAALSPSYSGLTARYRTLAPLLADKLEAAERRIEELENSTFHYPIRRAVRMLIGG